ATNPWGRLYTTDCAPVVDTITGESPADPTYRYVSGSGVNNDSTIAFDVTWYASGHPDSADFMVMHVALGPGPKYVSELTGVSVAYACDWDIPSDTGSDNRGYVDATEQICYQQGLYAGSAQSNELRYGGMAYRGHDETNEFASGGEVWDNPRYVYVINGYHVDTLSARVPGMSGWHTNIPDSSAAGDDLNSIIVIDNAATISAAKGTNPEFNIVFLGINPNENPSANYASILRKAETFICTYISPDATYCPQGSELCTGDPLTGCKPGDANGDDVVNITDAVYIIQYVFVPGSPAPRPWSICSGDANGDCVTNITDAVYIIQYVFVPGSPVPITCEAFELIPPPCGGPGNYNPGPW
ncbi:MAG: dockerin type I repeat-containing protein, partial [bacterium]